MPKASYHDDAGEGVEVRISPVLEREYKRRNVFPALRLDHALRIVNGATGVYVVAIDEAQKMLDDARAMQLDRELPRGLPMAYGCLARNLATELQRAERRGLWDDPGIEEVKRRLDGSTARFAVGDECLYFDNEDEYGREAKIIEGYRLYSVRADDGPYVKATGQRISYMYGYVIQLKGHEHTFFCRPFNLTRDDCQPSYLYLVSNAAGQAAPVSFGRIHG